MNLEVSMHGLGYIDAIEIVNLRHQQGNEGKKMGVKRLIGGFFGAKLLKRQEEVKGKNRNKCPGFPI
jgi:hypothetical protein